MNELDYFVSTIFFLMLGLSSHIASDSFDSCSYQTACENSRVEMRQGSIVFFVASCMG